MQRRVQIGTTSLFDGASRYDVMRPAGPLPVIAAVALLSSCSNEIEDRCEDVCTVPSGHVCESDSAPCFGECVRQAASAERAFGTECGVCWAGILGLGWEACRSPSELCRVESGVEVECRDVGECLPSDERCMGLPNLPGGDARCKDPCNNYREW
jgi:hypothetical protein